MKMQLDDPDKKDNENYHFSVRATEPRRENTCCQDFVKVLLQSPGQFRVFSTSLSGLSRGILVSGSDQVRHGNRR